MVLAQISLGPSYSIVFIVNKVLFRIVINIFIRLLSQLNFNIGAMDFITPSFCFCNHQHINLIFIRKVTLNVLCKCGWSCCSPNELNLHNCICSINSQLTNTIYDQDLIFCIKFNLNFSLLAFSLHISVLLVITFFLFF